MGAAKIEHMQIERGKRILVTSDIHGHLTYLKKALEKAQFSEDDILIIVGDIIEKGPESLQTLRYVMDLCKRGNVIPLLGNVDAWRLYMINSISEESAPGFYQYLLSLRDWYGTSFFDELTGELGYVCSSPEDMIHAKDPVLAHFRREFDFIANLPTVVETQNYIFVHGGLREKQLSENAKRDAFELIKFDNFMSTAHCFDKFVVVGHWPVSLYCETIPRVCPIVDREKRIISIDGGCGIQKAGQLNVLIIPEIDCVIEDVYHVSYDDMPLFRALTPQEGSTDPIHIRWTNNEIRILEKTEESSFVVHTETGRKLWIPNSCLLDDAHCGDYTDYVLPVLPGEPVSLITKISRGCIVKKDDTIGWYYGALEAVESL